MILPFNRRYFADFPQGFSQFLEWLDQGIEDTDTERHNEAAVDAILQLSLEQVSRCQLTPGTPGCLMCSYGFLGAGYRYVDVYDVNV